MGKEKHPFGSPFPDYEFLSEIQRLAHVGFFLFEWPVGKTELSGESLKILDCTKTNSYAQTEIFVNKIHPDHKDKFCSTITDSIRKGEKFDIEFRIYTRENKLKFVHCIGHPVSRSEGEPKIFGIIMDISDRKQTEEDLINEKEKTRTILDTCASFIVVIGTDKKVKLINKKGLKILGVKEKDIIGKNWFTNFIPKDQRKNVRSNFKKLMDGRLKEAEYFENAVISLPVNKKRWFEWHNTILKNGEDHLIGSLSSGMDITERKKSEKMRMDAAIEGEERERQRVARELHDGLLQVLSALRLNLKAIENEAERLPPLKKKAYQNALELVDNALSDTRDLSHRMMPRDLERFGLVDAAINLCEKINQSSSIRFEFTYSGKRGKLEKRYEVIIFRILQELINNILKHSGADHAWIKFQHKKKKFLLNVKDNGIGIKLKEHSNGIGLQNIASRVSSINGTLSINTLKRKGTSVNIIIPLKSQNEK